MKKFIISGAILTLLVAGVAAVVHARKKADAI